MCTPVAAVMTIMTVASTAAQIGAQRSQAKATARAAEDAAKADYEALSLQARQISEKGTAEGLAIKREALRTRGTLIASQMQSGVTGASPLREVMTVRLKEQEALAAAEGNVAGALMQNRAEMSKIRATAQGRVNEAYSRVPSSALAGLQIATSGLQGYATGAELDYQIKKGKALNA